MRLVNLTGMRFGKLVVVSMAPEEPGRRPRWICECDCDKDAGVRKQIICDGSNLRNGLSKSCGCGRVDAARARATHGRSQDRVYKIWKAMIYRCRSPKTSNWANYGGRGIRVHLAWQTSFEKWLAYVGEPPSNK